MDTYGGCCGSCVHLNINDYVGSKDRCKCTMRGGYHDLHESSCRSYEYDKYRDYYDLNRRWYIVTAIFKKLGLSDKYDCIEKLLDFRMNYVEKDSRYDNLLKDYDIVGPKLASLLTNDEDSNELCKKLCQAFLSRIFNLIDDNKNEEALDLYIEMVNYLKSIYEINLNDKEIQTTFAK